MKVYTAQKAALQMEHGNWLFPNWQKNYTNLNAKRMRDTGLEEDNYGLETHRWILDQIKREVTLEAQMTGSLLLYSAYYEMTVKSEMEKLSGCPAISCTDVALMAMKTPLESQTGQFRIHAVYTFATSQHLLHLKLAVYFRQNRQPQS